MTTPTALSDYVLSTSREYSIYVCKTRAIPHICDGLKDAERKALWLMRDRAHKIKTAALDGELKKELLYVHGSASGSINQLAAPYLNNVTFLEPHGNFGTRVAPKAFSADRYTEVARPPYAVDLIYPDLDLVPLEENYDGSKLQPVHFLPLIPLVLLNGASGIAIGWSTEVLPRKLSDLVDATVAAIEGKKIPRLVPDYAWCRTRCSLKETNANNDLVWEFKGSCEIVDTSTVHVTELPPDLTLEAFKERLNKFEEQEKIQDYEDRSSEAIDVTVRFKRGTIRDWTEDDAIEFLRLRHSTTERPVLLSLDGSAIKHYKVKDGKDPATQIIEEFVQWRFGLYKKRYELYVRRDDYELRFWKAVVKCFKADLPGKLQGFANKRSLVEWISGLNPGLDDDQLDRMANFATYRWTKEGLQEAQARVRELEDAVAEWKSILKDDEKRRGIFRDEVRALRKLKVT
jgi:DNA gyrase/topoisomerase IV subunit A